jgi:hypothetical protein
MKKIILLTIALSSLAASVIAAQTAPSPPPGWTGSTNGGAVILTAPGNEAARPVLTFLPTGHPQGERKTWFGNQVLAMAQAVGQVGGATETLEQQGILIRVAQVEDQKHRKIRLAFYGYPTASGLGVAVLAIPSGVSDQDPRLEQANQYVQQIAAQKLEASAIPLPAVPQTPTSQIPSRNGQGQYVGQFGRSDIDLTYHAKGIPPKDRDVPLKGVYVFVGFAFGAQYGGVGTTMTWGQHAVQQLLLLYDNGVAAKVDLRGGNLAGKYQAEGFVSLDVANPAAVSGPPFGHWTEDANSIHIQWNIGNPSNLARNGTNLEGNGERWTPFKLADGDLLEGTFVRKMEAGLRSQAIVLKKDGTFMGDGVNVTMGGSIVSPAFPERGGGRYEIRKGSMILYFSNGYTQAIACILDKTNTGDVKTVLLNGFPFEKVR